MFNHLAARRRFLKSRSSRANRRQVGFLRPMLEALEPRQMLSATTMDFNVLPPGFAVAEAHTEPQIINGVPFEFIADPTPAPVATGQLSSSATSGATHPLSSIPQLHSDPGARAKLYLDFDGHFEPTNGVTTPVYDRDGDPTTFSDEELNNMSIIWSRTAEDYAPFNIDVTTVEPPELAPGVPESAANGVALRVAIGGNGSWTGGVYGGIANIGAFTNSAANTVYVFSDNLDSTWTDWAGDVASHEAGHAFGLSHQSTYDQNGNRTNEYNPGDGTWAPLMGYNYVPVTTWYNGTSTSATTYQDDMAILAGSTNGFGYRADDHGNTIATADPLAFDGAAYSGSGIIGTNIDVDVWSFTVSAQNTYRLSVDPAAIAPNLDAVIELRTAAGSLIAQASPVASQAADLLLPLCPATYFLSVTKTAVYGWLGAYTVNVSTAPSGITLNAPQQIVTHEGQPGVSFTVVLDSQPSADVTIPISSSNVGEAVVSKPSLVFTPANWNVPQTVTITGVADGVRDSDVAYSVMLGPADSADLDYAGFDPADLAGVNLDSDAAGFLYFVDVANDAIKRSSLDGSAVQTLVDLRALFGGVDGDYSPRYVALDSAAGKLYWTDSTAGRIQRADLDGSQVETLLSGFTGGGLREIKLDTASGKMYWTDIATHKIQRANFDGSGVQDIVSASVSGARALVLDLTAGKLYWADQGTRDIRRANLDGTNMEVVWSGDSNSQPVAIALDTQAGKIYWSDGNLDKILRANLNGSQVEELIDTRAFFSDTLVGSLEIDAASGKIYFSDYLNGPLFRANLDGTDAVAILGASGRTQGIAILPPGVTVRPSSGLTTTESGGAAAFKVMLTTPPKSNVTIPIGSSNPQEGTPTQTSVTFTPANWNVPQTVTVVGVDDHVADGNQSYSVLLGAAVSADADYAGIDPPDVALTNIENSTKYFVVDDSATDRNYQYLPDGSFDSSTILASGNSAPRGVTSSAGSNKTWVINSNRIVYVYDTDGALLGSWTAGTMASNSTPQGIATDGTDIWIVDSRSDKVYRYAGAADRLSGSQNAASSFSLNSGNLNSTGLVTDGTSLWVTNNTTTDKVFKYSLAGTLAGSWTIDSANSNPVGIAIDPANPTSLLITDSGTDRVYQYTGAATRVSGSQSASSSFALASGNANPQGIVAVTASTGSVSSADLAVSSSAVSSTTEGNLVTFNLSVTNNGPDTRYGRRAQRYARC